MVTAAISATAGRVWFSRGGLELRRPRHPAGRPGSRCRCLGGLIILTKKDVAINTAHVVSGALVLGTSLVLTLRSHRVRFTDGAVSRARGCRHVSPARSAGVKDATLDLSAPAMARHRAADFFSLTKPRLNFLVVVTAAVGYYLGAGSVDPPEWWGRGYGRRALWRAPPD